jgi:threonine dehydrogenase-like Zn-dependent dehydrogenase
MITHHFPLDRVAEALKLNWEKPQDYIKVVIDIA